MTVKTIAELRTDVEESKEGSVPWSDAPVDASVDEPPPDSPGALPLEFFFRLLRFVEWEPGWDGAEAEHVDRATAERALRTAKDMLAVAPEPFVAPAPSGSLLLQWDFPGGRSVEVYVDGETDFPESATLTREGVVYEVDLAGPAALRSLLAEHAPMASAKP